MNDLEISGYAGLLMLAVMICFVVIAAILNYLND